jgi:hypothetical protein
MRKTMLCQLLAAALAAGVWAQDSGDSGSGGGGIDLQSMSPQFSMPAFNARFSMAFNYDFLRPPTQVSFDYPKGFFSFNIPIEGSINPLDIASQMNGAMDTIFSDTSIVTGGREMQPKASARQNPSTTIRVDVPMLGGVGTFANIQNVYLSYMNTLGMPDLKASTFDSSSGISMAMRGAISVPIDLNMSWETMVFGYAYKINKNFIFAFNLNRHVFRFDTRSNIKVDMLGYLKINQSMINKTINFDYSLGGVANAHYTAEPWSATLAAQLWRFGATARLGVKTKAHGSMNVNYSLPFFLDAETFKSTLTEENLMDISYINRLESNATSTFTHQSSGDMDWKLPDAYTFSFDLVRNKMNLSYTKMVGQMEIGLGNVWMARNNSNDTAAAPAYDTFNLKLGLPVDNVILLSGDFKNAFFHVGVFTLDVNVADREAILSSALKKANYVMLAGAPLFPVLNFGSALGTKMQVLLEVDLMPLIALKSGIVYYF